MRKAGTDGEPNFRGMGGSRVNILADDQNIFGGCGQRMDAPTAYIFPEIYDKVTVIKGPQTVLYPGHGSAATVRFEKEQKTYDKPGYDIHASGLVGSFGRHDEVVDANLGNKDYFATFTGSNSKSPINPDAVDLFAQKLEQESQVKIGITIAIEELEAWFLLVPEFFKYYSTALTNEEITSVIGFDLNVIDVETIAHPAQVISKVLQSVGCVYKKRLDDSHKIAEAIDYGALYLDKTLVNPTLKKFVTHLESALP